MKEQNQHSVDKNRPELMEALHGVNMLGLQYMYAVGGMRIYKLWLNFITYISKIYINISVHSSSN